MNFLEKLQQLEVEAMTTDEVYATWGTTKEQAHEQLLELVKNENHKAQARGRKAASNEAADNLKAIITARLARMKGYEDLGDKDKTPKASTAKRAFEKKDPGYVKKIIDRTVRSEWRNRVVFYRTEIENAGSSILKIGKPAPKTKK